MKNKKLKKLARLLFEEAKKCEKDETDMRSSPVIESSHNLYCDFDDEISNRVFNFITNLIKLENISISSNEYNINIYCNISQYKKHLNNAKIGNGIPNDEYIEINIDSNGFKINKDYSHPIGYRDTNIMEKLKPILTDRHKKISKERIIDIIDDVMVVTNLSRENNLDELLNS